MKAKRILICLSLLLMTGPLISAEEPPRGGERFHGLFNAWIGGELSAEELIEELHVMESALEENASSWANCYWRSRVSLAKGQVLFENGEKELSIMELQRSEQLAWMSIDIKNNSDSWRLLADAGSYMMLQKGMGYKIRNSSKVKAHAKMAMELDPENARASLVVAQYLMNAPRFVGGNRREGIELLQSLSLRTDLNREDGFYVLMALSKALQKDGQYNDAIRACRKALNSFPGSSFARETLSELQSKSL